MARSRIESGTEVTGEDNHTGACSIPPSLVAPGLRDCGPFRRSHFVPAPCLHVRLRDQLRPCAPAGPAATFTAVTAAAKPRVLDGSRGIAGAYAALLLRQFGADVVRAAGIDDREVPDGSPFAVYL